MKQPQTSMVLLRFDWLVSKHAICERSSSLSGRASLLLRAHCSEEWHCMRAKSLLMDQSLLSIPMQPPILSKEFWRLGVWRHSRILKYTLLVHFQGLAQGVSHESENCSKISQQYELVRQNDYLPHFCAWQKQEFHVFFLYAREALGEFILNHLAKITLPKLFVNQGGNVFVRNGILGELVTIF